MSMSGSIEEVYPLNMAENSVDDSYEGCREAMNDLVLSEYIEYEKKNTPGFAFAWENALKNCNKDGLNINQSAAIYLYTEDCNVNIDCSFMEFNRATRSGSALYKTGEFKFYTEFFFLTDAIQQLNQKRRVCETVYRKTKDRYDRDVFNKTIRFGSFTSSSLDRDFKGFGKESCFQIKTCLGAEIYNYSVFQEEREVLIPPYEVFRVTGIKTKQEVPDLWCNVVYELEHVGNKSNLKCNRIVPGSSALQPHCETYIGK
uniref:NAD(P)(+)--arginine ADP-ribosyltransferase n=1 Tax=Astyanax mexicanus TaxID=7994 RepID=A0A3B1J0X4_ASTMX